VDEARTISATGHPTPTPTQLQLLTILNSYFEVNYSPYSVIMKIKQEPRENIRFQGHLGPSKRQKNKMRRTQKHENQAP